MVLQQLQRLLFLVIKTVDYRTPSASALLIHKTFVKEPRYWPFND